MKIKHCFLLTSLIPASLFAQEKFKIEISAPSYINDNLLFSTPIIRKGFEDFYCFKLDTNNNVKNFGKRFGIKSAFFQITIQEKNIIEGQFDYPQPVSFQYFNSKTKQPYQTSTFYLDGGSFKVELPENFNSYEVKVNSPVNNEYFNFKKIYSNLYIKLKNRPDSLTDLKVKEERIGSYIKKHPNSYVAFWEIVNDYTSYNYNSIYLDNLQLFSDKIKKTALFKKFESKLKAETVTMKGKEFPVISFGKQNTLTKNDFKNYKLTFIDYWSTTCSPCIREMPQIVAMQNDYKDRSINFITVTAENEPERIKVAKRILNKNKVKWASYFDINMDFKNKVNANGYPLYFLVDQNGIIVTRVLGNLNAIKKIIDENLK